MPKTQDEFFAEFGRNASEIKFKGLKDGGHVLLKCSNCKAHLVDCWITRPDEKDPSTGEVIKWQVKATCPYCPASKSGKPEGSYIKEIIGGFTPGCIGELKNKETLDDQLITRILDIDIDEERNLVTLLIGKVDNVKPRR